MELTDNLANFCAKNESIVAYSEEVDSLQSQFCWCINVTDRTSEVTNDTSTVASIAHISNVCARIMCGDQVDHADCTSKEIQKQQQQRLLLLHHASKCPHDNGRCPVAPHCWSMKQLWKHIMSCKDQECKIPHCVSSRYVLSHYSKCKEPTCPVCGPVREAIKRNTDTMQESNAVANSDGCDDGNPDTMGPVLQSKSQDLTHCAGCAEEICAGYRHHCDSCAVDYCSNCVADSVLQPHVHKLFPVAVGARVEPCIEKQRSVRLHMQLLKHAAQCDKCESKNCHRMKEFLKHDGVCTVKTVGGCRLCARISNLLNIHASTCRAAGCRVPRCKHVRSQNRARSLRHEQISSLRHAAPTDTCRDNHP